eukprot:986496_1
MEEVPELSGKKKHTVNVEDPRYLYTEEDLVCDDAENIDEQPKVKKSAFSKCRSRFQRFWPAIVFISIVSIVSAIVRSRTMGTRFVGENKLQFLTNSEAEVMVNKMYPNEECSLFDVTYENVKFPMCLRTYSDLITRCIRSDGQWKECAPLPHLWDQGYVNTPSKINIFIDVGANIAACSLLMAAHDHHTLAFEPVPKNLVYLYRSIKENKFDNIEVYPFALSDSEGESTIAIKTTDNPGDSRIKAIADKNCVDCTFQIRTRKLDDVLNERFGSLFGIHVPLMKMDAQGHEPCILNGAQDVLSRGIIKIITIEFWPKESKRQNCDWVKILKYLDKFGYTIYKGEPTSEIRKMPRLKPSNFKAYVNNPPGPDEWSNIVA